MHHHPVGVRGDLIICWDGSSPCNVATLPVLVDGSVGDLRVTTTDSEGAEDERGSFGSTVDPNAMVIDGFVPLTYYYHCAVGTTPARARR